MTHRLGPALFAVVVAAAFFIVSASSQTPRSALGTPAASPVASPAGRAVSVTTFVAIHLTDTGVDPQSVEATNGHDLTITLVNDGARPHAFRIDRLAIDVRLLPGHTEIVVIRAPGFGDFPYSSDFTGDERRTGLLTFYSQSAWRDHARDLAKDHSSMRSRPAAAVPKTVVFETPHASPVRVTADAW